MKVFVCLVIVLSLNLVKANSAYQRNKIRKWKPPAKWFEDMINQNQEIEDSYNISPVLNNNFYPPEPLNFGEIEFQNLDPAEDEDSYEEERPQNTKFTRHTNRNDRRKLKSKTGEIKFQTLCPIKRQKVLLNTDDQYIYRPEFYEEVFCSFPFGGSSLVNERNKVCAESHFSCIQQNQTIFLSRRPINSDCWEVETREISSGCDCMWPRHVFGDINDHH